MATLGSKPAGMLSAYAQSPHPAGGSNTTLGVIPPAEELPDLPTFTPTEGSTGFSSGLNFLAVAATATTGTTEAETVRSELLNLHAAGPYNLAASLPSKVVKKILALEFVEISELWGDIWTDEASTSEAAMNPRRTAKPPVITITSWLECFARMAAVLTTRFPKKALPDNYS